MPKRKKSRKMRFLTVVEIIEMLCFLSEEGEFEERTVGLITKRSY